MSMTNLEQQLLGSRKIREFLKHFSETQWTRVLKASVIMGIQELERTSQVQHLSAQSIEDIVVKQEESIRLGSQENSQNISNGAKQKVKAKPQTKDSRPIKAVQNHSEQNLGVPKRATRHQPSEIVAISSQNSNSNILGVVAAGIPSTRKGGKSRQRVDDQMHEAQRQLTSESHSHINEIQAENQGEVIDAEFQQSQKDGSHTRITSKIVQQEEQSREKKVVRTQQSDRRDSQQLNLDNPKQQPQAQMPHSHRQMMQSGKNAQFQPARVPNPSNRWRKPRDMGQIKVTQQRGNSEQARFAQVSGVRESVIIRGRIQRNLLPAPEQLISGRGDEPLQKQNNQQQRSRSLNPLIYPSWWGDEHTTSDEEIRRKSRNGRSRVDQGVAATEEPKLRNQAAFNPSELNQLANQQYNSNKTLPGFSQGGAHYYVENGVPQNVNANNQTGGYPGLNASMVSSSQISLADALQQARDTAERLERNIDDSRKQRAQMLRNGQDERPIRGMVGAAEGGNCISHEDQNAQNYPHDQYIHEEQQMRQMQQKQQRPAPQEGDYIVNIRNDKQIEQTNQMDSNRQYSQNNEESGGHQISGQKEQFWTARPQTAAASRQNARNGSQGYENVNLRGNNRMMSRGFSERNDLVGLGNNGSHSARPQTTKAQLARQEFNSKQLRQREMQEAKKAQQMKNKPAHLSQVRSKIADMVRQDKAQTAHMPSQDVPVQVFDPRDNKKQKADRKYQNQYAGHSSSQNQRHFNNQNQRDTAHIGYNQYNNNFQQPYQNDQQFYDAQGKLVQQQNLEHPQEYYPEEDQYQQDHHQERAFTEQSQTEFDSQTERESNQNNYPNKNDQQQIGVDSSDRSGHELMNNNGDHLRNPHIFSQHQNPLMDNSNSMVMYNATVRNGGTTLAKTEASAIVQQNTTDQTQTNMMLSHQGNQILFDSKGFDKMSNQQMQQPQRQQMGLDDQQMMEQPNYYNPNNDYPPQNDQNRIEQQQYDQREDSASQQQYYHPEEQQDETNDLHHQTDGNVFYGNNQGREQFYEQDNYDDQDQNQKIMTFKSQDQRGGGQLGGPLGVYQQDSRKTYDKRASQATMSQMTNPFKTKHYGNQYPISQHTNGNQTNAAVGETTVLSENDHQMNIRHRGKEGKNRQNPLQGVFYPPRPVSQTQGENQEDHPAEGHSDDRLSASPEEQANTSAMIDMPNDEYGYRVRGGRKVRQHNHGGADPDPSSSSMSGYDLKGIITRAHQNHNQQPQPSQGPVQGNPKKRPQNFMQQPQEQFTYPQEREEYGASGSRPVNVPQGLVAQNLTDLGSGDDSAMMDDPNNFSRKASQPHQQANRHQTAQHSQMTSYQPTAASGKGGRTSETPLPKSASANLNHHVVSQQNPVSEGYHHPMSIGGMENTQTGHPSDHKLNPNTTNVTGGVPSSYHPVISQDFNPLKTTIGNSNNEEMMPHHNQTTSDSRINNDTRYINNSGPSSKNQLHQQHYNNLHQQQIYQQMPRQHHQVQQEDNDEIVEDSLHHQHMQNRQQNPQTQLVAHIETSSASDSVQRTQETHQSHSDMHVQQKQMINPVNMESVETDDAVDQAAASGQGQEQRLQHDTQQEECKGQITIQCATDANTNGGVLPDENTILTPSVYQNLHSQMQKENQKNIVVDKQKSGISGAKGVQQQQMMYSADKDTTMTDDDLSETISVEEELRQELAKEDANPNLAAVQKSGKVRMSEIEERMMRMEQSLQNQFILPNQPQPQQKGQLVALGPNGAPLGKPSEVQAQMFMAAGSVPSKNHQTHPHPHQVGSDTVSSSDEDDISSGSGGGSSPDDETDMDTSSISQSLASSVGGAPQMNVAGSNPSNAAAMGGVEVGVGVGGMQPFTHPKYSNRMNH